MFLEMVFPLFQLVKLILFKRVFRPISTSLIISNSIYVNYSDAPVLRSKSGDLTPFLEHLKFGLSFFASSHVTVPVIFLAIFGTVSNGKAVGASFGVLATTNFALCIHCSSKYPL